MNCCLNILNKYTKSISCCVAQEQTFSKASTSIYSPCKQEMGGKRSDEQKIEFIFQSLLTDGQCPAGWRREGGLLRLGKGWPSTFGEMTSGGINISTVIAFDRRKLFLAHFLSTYRIKFK